ncbi:hypothetical protein CN383_27165 [Priestia megaterium]|uniref:AVAST type 1 anti-phage system MBL fold metallo-hydrolase Avs1a n=1 Tax=Priestia megaterium TaxID=1404 RepID=UPI000BF30CBF|nr:AVAST type 1 anti-phage system MBL fold metallo-hydrolase Avs1a [Priestia megaterium]PFA94008.1 hypothetical protein CN383_27165 [Priestia megaterium]
MHSLRVSMLPASFGDCLLVNYHSLNSGNVNILIDTGFVSTYKTYLKPKLLKMKEEGQHLDLMVITHIDRDHISGALSFFKENGLSVNSQIIEVKEVWHNSYRHLQTPSLHRMEIENRVDKGIIEEVSNLGYPEEKEIVIDYEEDVSAEQGSSVAALLDYYKYAWNSSFDNKVVNVENKRIVDIGDEIKLIILSPDNNKLDNLKEYWKDKLEEMGFRSDPDKVKIFDDAFEFLMAHEKIKSLKDFNKDISSTEEDIEELLKEDFIEDMSVVNGSSISFILETKNQKILFLADSHPSIITRELKQLYGEGIKWFDAIKISHHGSKGNTSPELLKIIDSNNFFISTNGSKHNHPDLVTIARIISRESKHLRNIIFNYKTEVSNYLDNNSLKERYKYEVKILEEGEEYII